MLLSLGTVDGEVREPHSTDQSPLRIQTAKRSALGRYLESSGTEDNTHESLFHSLNFRMFSGGPEPSINN